eukprot:3577708-Alexandrium_andersonii.AAC.1
MPLLSSPDPFKHMPCSQPLGPMLGSSPEALPAMARSTQPSLEVGDLKRALLDGFGEHRLRWSMKAKELCALHCGGCVGGGGDGGGV